MLKFQKTDIRYSKGNKNSNYNIVVLINKASASASEVLAAALKESYGASIVGTKSYGKGKVQQVVKLKDGDSVKYTSGDGSKDNPYVVG